MNALPQHAPSLPAPGSGRAALSLDALAVCVRALDPGSRALLDLSLRRRLPFEAMAGVLHTDPFDLARRRARAVARIAAELDLEGAGVVATVKAALARLPDDAWGVPVVRDDAQPVPNRAVQAESMAEAARALMERLREHREAVRAAAQEEEQPAGEQPTVEMEAVVDEPGPALAPADQPTVESEAIVLPAPEEWPAVAATPTAAAFSHHPAFAVEADDEAAALPPLAEALARAAASERAAADAEAQVDAPAPVAAQADPPPARPAPPTQPAPAPRATDRPAPPLAVPHAAEREPRRRLARGGLAIGLLLALLRLLFGRR